MEAPFSAGEKSVHELHACAQIVSITKQNKGFPMTPKALMNVTIALMVIHGLGLMVGAGEAAKMGIESISDDALNMGKGAYEIAAFFNFFLAAVLISARKVDIAAMRAISKGIAVGYGFLVVAVAYHMQTLIPGQAPPAPALAIVGGLAAWALYVAFGTKDDPAVVTD